MTALLRRTRPYVFWGQTTSLCETCLALVPAKIAIKGNEVWYEKRCDRHGTHSTLISTDAAYWRLCKDYIKPGDRPLALQSHTKFGCPYDCGLCPDHEQHSCLALIEINEHCNLTCPVCFADSSPTREKHLQLPVIERMVDALVASEASPTWCSSPAASRRCIPPSSPCSTRCARVRCATSWSTPTGCASRRSPTSPHASPSRSAGSKSTCSSIRSDATP
jgi:hypothetical protein